MKRTRVPPDAVEGRWQRSRAWQTAAMILESAALPVRPGAEDDFEAAFAQARPLIQRQPGCHSARLLRCVERPSTYLLLVEWETLEAHTEGFRGSPEYQTWRALLHHFYEPMPVVEHFAPVSG
jgi:heme-degrading monooxygenase HmoA